MTMTEEVVEFAGGDVRLWIEKGQTICLKAVTASGDPVVLAVQEVNELVRALQILKARLD